MRKMEIQPVCEVDGVVVCSVGFAFFGCQGE